MRNILLLILTVAHIEALAFEKVSFKSADGVLVTADLHLTTRAEAPLILMFHQAGWSRGEYLELAPTFNRLGYHCLVVDLRSGNLVNGIRNETAKDAQRLMKQVSYLDAYQDVRAAWSYTCSRFPNTGKILFGSSYSASLVLMLGAELDGALQAVVAFSPGEYFRGVVKDDQYVTNRSSLVNIPTFVGCANNEQQSCKAIFDAIAAETKTFYYPTETTGNHGAKALFTKYSDHKEYWSALLQFLSTL